MKKLSSITILLVIVSFSCFAQNFVSTTPSNQNVVLEELTGMYCTFCPDGHKRASELKANNPGKVVLVNVHAGSYAIPQNNDPDYRTPTGNYINNLLDPDGYPAGAINRIDHNGNGREAMSRQYWVAVADSVMNQPSPVNVAAMADLDVATGELTVNVEAYYTSNGIGLNDKLHVFILQNNVKGPQTGSQYNPSQLTPQGDYIHNHMFRYALTGNYGDDIDTISASTLVQRTYTYTIPENFHNIKTVMSDLEIVVFVSDDSRNIYTGEYASINFTSSATGAMTSIIAAESGTNIGTCDAYINPTVQLFNSSADQASSIKISYDVNGNSNGSYIIQSANLETGAGTYTVPSIPLETGNNVITLTVDEINGIENTELNNASFSIEVTSSTPVAYGPGNLLIEIVTDNYGSEIEWELINQTSGVSLASGGPYQDGTTGTSHDQLIELNDENACYSFIITDSYGDGICCNEGQGSYTVTLDDAIIKQGGQYGSIEGFYFQAVPYATSISNVVEQDVKVFPNPAIDVIYVTSSGLISGYEIQDLSGKVIQKERVNKLSNIQINTQSLAQATYVLKLYSDQSTVFKKFSIAQ